VTASLEQPTQTTFVAQSLTQGITKCLAAGPHQVPEEGVAGSAGGIMLHDDRWGAHDRHVTAPKNMKEQKSFKIIKRGGVYAA